MPNSKVVGITQTDDGDLILLMLGFDSKYMSHSLQVVNKVKNGEIQRPKTLEINNIYDLTALEQKSSNEFSVFGNTTQNKTFEPFQLNISKNGDKLLTIQLPQVYSTLISDVVRCKDN